MPYKPTGKPPGRPRKRAAVTGPDLEPADAGAAAAGQPAVVEGDGAPAPLKRIHKAYRQAFPDPADELHRPPRYGDRRRHVGKRPILHPNVIAGGSK